MYETIFHIDCSELNGTLYGHLLDEALRDLDRSILFISEAFHGEDHILRTMANGAYIACGEGYTPEETRLLLLCCSYHDIGRVSEGTDFEHGPRAAERILHGEVQAFASVAEESVRIAAAAISVHSQSDSTAPSYQKQYGITNKNLYLKMVRGLKDADNLDRVRLKDLDSSHLRTKAAKNGIPFAEKMLQLVPPKMEPWWL